jgi:hypothetical protein
MFGTFQQSQLRIEIAATSDELAHCLLYPAHLQAWLWPQQFSGAPDKLVAGAQFTSHFGPIALRHQVTTAEDTYLRSLLAESIDGFHEWYWGDGWVQSRLEGVSLLPLKLIQSLSLMRLQAQFGEVQHSANDSASADRTNDPEASSDAPDARVNTETETPEPPNEHDTSA